MSVLIVIIAACLVELVLGHGHCTRVATASDVIAAIRKDSGFVSICFKDDASQCDVSSDPSCHHVLVTADGFFIFDVLGKHAVCVDPDNVHIFV
jgi:hypothetical protein